jgi:thioredoxin:protein disulfide reductase
MKLQLGSLLLLISFALPFSVFATEPINSNPLTAEFTDKEILIAPGSSGKLLLKLKLAKGYHAYLDRFKFTVSDPQEIKVENFKLQPIVKFFDPLSKTNKDGVKDRAELEAEVSVPGGLGSGVLPLNFSLTYQACTEEHCLFPKTIQLTTQLNTSGVKGATAPVEMKKPAKNSSEFSMALEKSVFSALLLAFLVGLATSLTPCIYPMIPITLAVLGARKANQSHFRGFAIALTYVLGIAFTYSILGLIAASTGGAFGRALGNINAVTVIALVFVVMGLSMYGFIEIQIPSWIQTKLGFAHRTSGFAGAFGAGLAAGIVASPCVGPVLISILTYIAQTKDLLFGFVYLFVFALGIGFPFLILGTFSQLIGRLPKAGPWMEFVKFAFGTIMIGVAFFYIEPVYPQWLFHLLMGLAMIFIASVYGAFETVSNLRVHPEDPITKGAFARLRKGLMIALLITGIGFFAHGLMNKFGIRFATSTQDGSAIKVAPTDGLPFEAFSMEKLYVAQKEKKPVLIDFFAEWCAACKELEEYTFTDARVRELGRDFVLLRFDATEDNAEVNAILKEFNVIGLPTLVFFDRKGEQRDDERVTGFEDADRFIQRLKNVLK